MTYSEILIRIYSILCPTSIAEQSPTPGSFEVFWMQVTPGYNGVVTEWHILWSLICQQGLDVTLIVDGEEYEYIMMRGYGLCLQTSVITVSSIEAHWISTAIRSCSIHACKLGLGQRRIQSLLPTLSFQGTEECRAEKQSFMSFID